MSAEHWVVNGAQNWLAFGTDAIPGYGSLGGAVYASHAGAEAELGVGNALPLKFAPQNYVQQYPSGPTNYWPWSTAFAVYFSRSGTLLGIFGKADAAALYASKLGAGYVSRPCTLTA